MLKNLLFTIYISACSIGTLSSQPLVEWVSRCHETARNFYVYDAAIDENENIYLTGSDFVYDNKLIKVNAAGNIVWIRTNAFASGYHIKLDNAGNIYLGGFKDNLYEDFWVTKYDPEGNVIWENSYPHSGYHSDVCLDMIIDNAGNVYATGYISSLTGYKEYCTIKYNSDGTRNWVNIFHYGVDYLDVAKSITLDNNNNVLITGEVYDSTSALVNCTIKYNNAGDLVWYKIIPGNLFEAEKIFYRAPNIFVTGGAVVNAIGTASYNSNGDMNWLRVTPAGTGGPNDILIDNIGNLVITGQLFDSVSQTYSAHLLKYSLSGTLLWAISHTSGNYSFGKSLCLDEYSNVYVLGAENPNSNNNLFTMKYNENGNRIWFQPYMNNIDSFYTPVKILHSNDKVYSIANVLRRDSLRYEALIIKYSQTIGIQPISSETPNQFSLSQNYPNPFNPTTKIRFEISGQSVAQTFLSVYDVTGKEIDILVNAELKPGTYEVNWNASSYPSGVYFYNLSTGSFTETKKMILMK